MQEKEFVAMENIKVVDEANRIIRTGNGKTISLHQEGTLEEEIREFLFMEASNKTKTEE